MPGKEAEGTSGEEEEGAAEPDGWRLRGGGIPGDPRGGDIAGVWGLWSTAGKPADATMWACIAAIHWGDGGIGCPAQAGEAGTKNGEGGCCGDHWCEPEAGAS